MTIDIWLCGPAAAQLLLLRSGTGSTLWIERRRLLTGQANGRTDGRTDGHPTVT